MNCATCVLNAAEPPVWPMAARQGAAEYSHAPVRHKRGGGKWVNTVHRDRARALQLMQQAMPLAAKDQNKADGASVYLTFGRLLLNGTRYHEAWRLRENAAGADMH